LIDEIEAIFAAIAEHDDFGAFERKIERIRAFGAACRLAPALGAC
jgi:hypothetical protein